MYELHLGASRVHRPYISKETSAVGLFCLLGLTISAAILSMHAADDVFWALVNAS
jgi:hypothetical protein